MNRGFLFLSALVLSSFSLHAGYVKLTNDSHYTLRAEVRGNDGTLIGDVVIKPHQISRLVDSYSLPPPSLPNGASQEGPVHSFSSYSVRWFCMDGDEFSFCSLVPSGATAVAKSCTGRKKCGLKKKEKKPASSIEQEAPAATDEESDE